MVENAIRHGIDPAENPGSITISAERIEGNLRLCVSDTGAGLNGRFVNGHYSGGVGLSNTRARLETLYPGAHRFDIGSRKDGGVDATILIPIRPLQD